MSHITVRDLHLDFPVYNVNTMSIRGQLASIGSGGILKRLNQKNAVVEALRGISFELENGDRLGLVGRNGAGKTTLLKVLANIYQPTKGEVISKGHISTMFDVGLGMDENATGVENIRLILMLRGFSRRSIDGLIPEISDFTELGDFLEMPLRTYSAGMRTRLSFAVATQLEPEILLMDEVIGAGDAFFTHKAQKRIEDMLSSSRILVLASHSEEIIREFCSKALWLEQGTIKMFGGADEVLLHYRDSGT